MATVRLYIEYDEDEITVDELMNEIEGIDEVRECALAE